MSIARRPKNPEKVRRLLLDAAAHIAVEGQGTGAITVEAVCSRAGVTKGAFFHHFPAKAALIAELFSDLLERFDLWLTGHIAADPDPHGRFSRAYVAAVTEPGGATVEPLWAVAYVAALADGDLRQDWAGWMTRRLLEAGEDPDDPQLSLARLAADGLWLAEIAGTGPGAQARAALRERLIAQTRSPETRSPETRNTLTATRTTEAKP